MSEPPMTPAEWHNRETDDVIEMISDRKKMTDEEMAEEQIKKWDSVLYPQMYPVALVKDFIRKAYLAGLKAGRPKWHKVSEQIPTKEEEYLVKLTDGTVDVMTVALDGDLEPYLLTPKFDFYKYVEKWCEIPKE